MLEVVGEIEEVRSFLRFSTQRRWHNVKHYRAAQPPNGRHLRAVKQTLNLKRPAHTARSFSLTGVITPPHIFSSLLSERAARSLSV